MVKEKSFITIQSFMINELKLKGNELIIYAVIFGFSQDGESVFSGSLNYLAGWTNSSKQGVLNSLKKLLDKNLIEKNEIYKNGVKYCEYHTTNLNTVLNKVDYPYSTNLNGGIKQSLPNNIINNINNNIINNKGATAPAPKKTVKKFVPPTREEIVAYCQSKGYNIDVDHFISTYSPDGGTWRYKDGSPVKDWKRCCVTWAYNGKKYDAQRSAGRGNLYGNENDCAQVYAGIL